MLAARALGVEELFVILATMEGKCGGLPPCARVRALDTPAAARRRR